MSFGRHWEWRGFGDVEEELRARVTSYPLYLQTEIPMTDIYLWTPRAKVNVKLRGDSLKFKRFIAREGVFECWLEDEAEVFPFPLSGEVLRRLGEALEITLPDTSPIPRTETFLSWLRKVTPKVRVVPVEKQRSLHLMSVPKINPVIVELSEVLVPEIITTFALEHPQLPVLRTALAQFSPLIQNLQPLSYFEALALWAQGQPLRARPVQG